MHADSSNTSLHDRILTLDSVTSVQNFGFAEVPKEGFTLLPFLCPFRYKPFSAVTSDEGKIVGVTTGYRDGITEGSKSKIDRVRAFWNGGAFHLLEGSRIRFLMGDSDIYACSSIFPKAPVLPTLEDFDVVSNRKIWEENGTVSELENSCDELYEKYSLGIQEVIQRERDEHLQVDGTMYDANLPRVWKEKMIRRIISSYMLDGILMSRGVYGPNPIILGVEALSTTTIQNAALSDEKKIPVIMLKP